MYFENKLIDSLFSLYEDGYQAPSTLSFHRKCPILETGPFAQSLQPFSTLRNFPSLLVLGATLHPIQSPAPLKAEFLEGGESCGVVSVADLGTSYHRYGRHTSLELKYRGQGSYQVEGKSHAFVGSQFEGFSLEVPPSGLLYEKPFKLTNLSHILIDAQPLDHPGQYQITPPGGINTFPRFPYGGHYVPGMPLEKVQQLYLFVRKFQSKTEPLAESTSDFLERGIKPPLTSPISQGEIVFLEAPTPHEQMNLAEALNQGCAEITVWKDKDSASPISCAYKSIGFTLEGDHLVSLMFEKRP